MSSHRAPGTGHIAYRNYTSHNTHATAECTCGWTVKYGYENGKNREAAKTVDAAVKQHLDSVRYNR